MLTILETPRSSTRFCDGLSRRGFLTAGGMLGGGFALPALLEREARAGTGGSHKALINVFLPGGPPHQDMWDLKPHAPREIRGEFRPIRTNIPGIEIGELFPQMAKMMDKFIILRSIVGARGPHYATQCMTGYHTSPEPAGGRPALGAWASHLQGPAHPSVPPHISLCYDDVGHREWGDPGNGGFLGMAHAPCRLARGKDRKAQPAGADGMVLEGVSLERLQDRRRLLHAFDRFRRDADVRGQMAGLDRFTEQALGILTSSRLADALDLSKEDPRILARYGKGDPQYRADGAPKMTENFLLARRLVEAGARVVSLNFSRWDWHGQNFQRGREDMPMLDRALSALVTDLHERGLDQDVTVICWGEFGRTPKINKNAGRDHWPRVTCAAMAGGGMRTGQVVGATDRLGDSASERPITFQEVFATLYTNLGLDIDATRAFDLRGRPYHLVQEGVRPIHEVLG